MTAASDYGRAEVVALLIKRGANIDAHNNVRKYVHIYSYIRQSVCLRTVHPFW